GHGVAGALQIESGGILQALFDKVWQFEVLEEHIEELFLGKRELERVLAAAVGAALAAALTFAAGRTRDLVSPNVFLVAGNDVIGFAGAAVVVEDRLGKGARRDRGPFSRFVIAGPPLPSSPPPPPPVPPPRPPPHTPPR